MNQMPEFDSWDDELAYYAQTIREMEHSAYPDDEDMYIRSSRYYLVEEICQVLEFLNEKGLYKEYADIRNHS